MFHTLAKVDDYICGHWAHGVHKMPMWTGAEHRLNKPQYIQFVVTLLSVWLSSATVPRQ